MSPTVLVAVSSRHGSTDELARKIAATIAEHGLAVDVRPMDEVDTVFPYEALVLGSAVYMGRWLRDAREFVDLHRDGRDRALPLSTSHLFGGRLVKSSLNLRERAFAGLLHVPEGDYREWAAAAAWATAIARTLADQRAA